MKLAHFDVGGHSQIGLVEGTRIVSLTRALPRLPVTMVEIIAQWESVRTAISGLHLARAPGFLLTDVVLNPPITQPGKVMAIGLNYADHVAETGAQSPAHQLWFCKTGNTVHAPYAPIKLPRVSNAVDYEAELVFIIGTGGRYISREAAPRHVFGYCVGNDVTARDWQRRTPQWVLGKSFDTHGPFGPWITTADEIGDPHRLGIRARVNGELRQESNTRELIFSVFDQIAHLSEVMTLQPGDVVFSGTPGGVGAMMKPPVFLREGDRVQCEIDELGMIEAVCEAE
ncbi:MAG: fumarylacetoacetate hydrolase family protein [Gammaproteobacteria bacterium]|jgi:ureidoglycolate lyase|nr:fumarylacetoacetate hydrolase family protein [Gammaproteobacteria bacterium]